MFPERFNNKTNGITQRRFLLHGNPLLADWVTKKVGDGWITDLPQIGNKQDNGWFQQSIDSVKRKVDFFPYENQIKKGEEKLADQEADKIPVNAQARKQCGKQYNAQGKTKHGREESEVHFPKPV